MRASQWIFRKRGGQWELDSRCCPVSGVAIRDIEESVYVITYRNKVVYVGEAGNGVERIRKGLRHSIKQSIAYKWRDRLSGRNPILQCYVFDGFGKRLNLSDPRRRKALEADLAYQLRKRIGAWPAMLSGLSPVADISRTKVHSIAVDRMIAVLERMGGIPERAKP